MGSGPLIWLAYKAAVSRGHAKDIDASEHGQRGERHGHWNKCARHFDDGAERVGGLIHNASYSWEDSLTERRPNHVCRREQAAAAFEQRFKLRAVALSPRAGIQAHQQAGESGIHRASSRPSPALVNWRNVANFARRTCKPLAVMR